MHLYYNMASFLYKGTKVRSNETILFKECMIYLQVEALAIRSLIFCSTADEISCWNLKNLLVAYFNKFT